MRLLLNCCSSNEFLDGFDRAVLDLHPDLANLILRRIELFTQIAATATDLYEMRYPDSAVEWLNDEHCDGDDDAIDALITALYNNDQSGGPEFVAIPDTVEIGGKHIARSEGDYMVIRNVGVSVPCYQVCWVCRPVGTEDHCETADIDLETLQIALTGQPLPWKEVHA